MLCVNLYVHTYMHMVYYTNSVVTLMYCWFMCCVVQCEMSVTSVSENGARLEEVRGDLDQIRHWVATQVSGYVGPQTLLELTH